MWLTEWIPWLQAALVWIGLLSCMKKKKEILFSVTQPPNPPSAAPPVPKAEVTSSPDKNTKSLAKCSLIMPKKEHDGDDDKEEKKELAKAENGSNIETKEDVGATVEEPKKDIKKSGIEAKKSQNKINSVTKLSNVTSIVQSKKLETAMEVANKAKAETEEGSRKTKTVIQPKLEENIQVEPKELHWEEKFGQAVIKITNTSGHRLALKVKISDPEIYSTAPVYFFLSGRQTEKLTVVRKDSPFKEDCVVIAYCEAPDGAKEVADCFKKSILPPRHTTIKMLIK